MIKMINLVKYFLSATRKKKIVIYCKSFNCEWYKLLFIHTVWSVNDVAAGDPPAKKVEIIGNSSAFLLVEGL